MRRGFRLASVLRYRQHELERAMAAHAKAMEAEREASRTAAEAALRADVARSRMRQDLRDGLSASRLRAVAEGLTNWETRVEELALRASDAAAELVARRSDLLEARKRVKALERLEENHERERRVEEARSEQKVLDEVGVQRLRNGVAWALLWVLVAVPALPGAVRAEPASKESTSEAEDHSVTALLAEIRARQTDLERRERELDDRERSVVALEAAAAEQLVELERIAKTVEGRIAAWEEDNGDSVRRLSKIYSAMQPARAAALLEELDVSLATQIVAKMKHKQSAAVMTQLSESRALAMSRRVAHPLGMNPAQPPASKEN